MKILSIHDLATIRKGAAHNLSLREESNEKVTERCYGLVSGAQHLQIPACGGTGATAALQSCFNAVNNHRREKVFLPAPRSVNGCKRNGRGFVRILKSATSHLSIYIL